MTMQTVLYSKLKAPEAINAREADGYDEQGIAELAALINAKGLLQPLVVRPASKGVFEIIAGKRRYLAIGKLIDDLVWPVGQEIPVTVRDDDDDEALETSLIENIARKPMHPVQELEVFARVHGGPDGLHVKAIAERYGVTVKHVEQTLALGALAPEILEAWRNKEISRDVAEAFSICPDQKKQAAALKAIKKQAWNGRVEKRDVEQFFRKQKTSVRDGRVQFVGIDAYKEAGGKVVANLFGDGYIENDKLLDKLFAEKLKTTLDELVADGWSWAMLLDEVKPSGAHYSWARATPKTVKNSELQKRLDEIKDEIQALQESDDPDADDRFDELSEERDTVTAAIALGGFSDKQKSETGCIVSVVNGRVRIEAGYMRGKTRAQLEKEQQKAKDAKAKKSGADDEADSPAPTEQEDEGHLSAALLSDIGAWQTTAVAEALVQCPQLAIQIAAAALQGGPSYGDMWPVRVNVDGMSKYFAKPTAKPVTDKDPDNEEDDDDEFMDTSRSGFAAALAAVPPKQAAQVLADRLSRALDLRQIKFKMVSDADRDALVNLFPAAVYLAAMRAKFDAEDYFKRASGKIAIAALDEMGVTFERSAKKPVHAATAAEEALARGWLPVQLRNESYALLKRPKKAA